MSQVNPAPQLAPWRDALLIVLLAPSLIAGCYNAGFLEYDDSTHYLHTQVLPNFPLSEVWRPAPSTYFPLTVVSYRLDRFLFETTPPAPMRRSKAAPYVRLHSLLLHVFAGLCLWRALLHLRLGRWMSLFAAAAWTVHPAACESVCWISERKNVLAALFGFASLWVYFGGISRPWRREALTFLLFSLAMLGKANAAGYLPIYVAYDALLWWRARSRNTNVTVAGKSLDQVDRVDQIDGVRCGLFYLFCIGAMLLLVMINVRNTQSSLIGRAGNSLWAVALTDVPILAHYIYNMLLPTSLSIFYYSAVVTSLNSAYFWTHACSLALFVALTLWASRDRPRSLFLWIWFVGALGPALNIVPIPYLMQDRFAYFSLPTLLVLAADTVSSLAAIWSARRSNTRLILVQGRYVGLIVVLALALASALRSTVYHDDLRLMGDAAMKQPQSAYAHLHYALTLSGSADVTEFADRSTPEELSTIRSEALTQLIACKQSPDFDRMLDPGRVHILIAVLQERLGHRELAYPMLIDALKTPQIPYNTMIACQSLARIELLRGRPDVAIAWIDSGVKSTGDPLPSPEILYLKGLCLEQLQRFKEACDLYRQIPRSSLAYDHAQQRLTFLLSEVIKP